MTDFNNAKYGDIISAMAAIGSDREKAVEFFEAYVKHILNSETNNLRDDMVEARRIASANLGYLMGYAPESIDIAMWRSVGAEHPVFGGALEQFAKEKKT